MSVNEVPPLVAASDVGRWNDVADVIVVGFGMAGACAAITAAESGADVLVVERAGASGGTTAMAAGHFYLGGGTPVQEAAGFSDTPEEMFRYLEASTPEPDRNKIRHYCDDSVEHFHWLESQGAVFERSFYAGKGVYQPGTEGLMWTGNENVAPYRDLAVPAPRGHKVAVEADGGGAVLMLALTERARSLGVRVRYDTTAAALFADETGRIRGLRTRSFSDRADLRGGAVVLAAGGYVMDKDMVAAHTPRLASRFLPLGGPYDDGTGIRLGQSAGGTIEHMAGAFISAPFYPPASLLKGIIVNQAGERFVAEDSYHGRIAGHVLEQPGAAAYLIVGGDDVEWPELGLVPFIDGWNTVSEMAVALDIPSTTLQATFDAHERFAAAGEDSSFGKSRAWLASLGPGPYAAFDLTAGVATYVGFTLGGLRTSLDAEVLAERDQPILGLFAAGACASNIAQDCIGYASGTCLGESSYFGRRAGVKAAEISRR